MVFWLQCLAQSLGKVLAQFSGHGFGPVFGQGQGGTVCGPFDYNSII
jgi:hypothetical protein